MGQPKFQRKKYSKPTHPWQRARIESEGALVKEYGLKNKKELWKTDSRLRNLKTQAKRLIKIHTEQGRKEEQLFRKRLAKYDLLLEEFKLEDVLALQPKDLFDLRLQTQVFKQGLAKTVKQARQFIIHNHILVNDKKMDIPSYLVKKTDKISFSAKSKLSNTEHPERPKEKVVVKTQLELPKKKVEEASLEKNLQEEKKKETKKKTPAKKKKEEKVPTAHELAEKKKETKEEKK